MRRGFARLADLGRCDRGAVTADFVVLLGGVVLIVLAVFSSLTPGGGMNGAVASLLGEVALEMDGIFP